MYLNLDEDGDRTAANSTRDIQECVHGSRDPRHCGGAEQVPAATTIFQIFDWKQIRRVRHIKLERETREREREIEIKIGAFSF